MPLISYSLQSQFNFLCAKYENDRRKKNKIKNKTRKNRITKNDSLNSVIN